MPEFIDRILKRASLGLLALCAVVIAQAQPVDLGKSSLTFGFKQENVPGEGRFKRFSADVSFDPAKPQATRAVIDVDTTSIDLGDPQWSNDVQAPSWFATKANPRANVTATTAKPLGGGRFEASGKLTLKGVTRDVVATFTTKPDPAGLWIEGAVPVRRTEFRIGEGTWADTSVVADEVQIRFKLLVGKR